MSNPAIRGENSDVAKSMFFGRECKWDIFIFPRNSRPKNAQKNVVKMTFFCSLSVQIASKIFDQLSVLHRVCLDSPHRNLDPPCDPKNHPNSALYRVKLTKNGAGHKQIRIRIKLQHSWAHAAQIKHPWTASRRIQHLWAAKRQLQIRQPKSSILHAWAAAR